MIFNKISQSEDYHLRIYKDDACSTEIGYIGNAKDGVTVALTVNGSNDPSQLTANKPGAFFQNGDPGEPAVAYPDKAKVFTDMKAFTTFFFPSGHRTQSGFEPANTQTISSGAGSSLSIAEANGWISSGQCLSQSQSMVLQLEQKLRSEEQGDA
ncbi:MAG: hypothetical protein M1812_005343 [Candelaria pacifica]|nr:MAG: hypothetical protein M1812_005343 [Candelaria pacifica]